MTQIYLKKEKTFLENIQAGDERAFEQVYNYYKKQLTRNVVRLVKSEEAAEEIVQDLFMKVWENRETIDLEKSFRSYLYKVAENMVFDMFRKAERDKKVQGYLMSASTELYSHIEEDIFQKEDEAMLMAAINKLPPQRRRVYILFKLKEMTYKEISDEVGIGSRTINEHIQKANESVKNELNSMRMITITLIASAIICQVY